VVDPEIFVGVACSARASAGSKNQGQFESVGFGGVDHAD